MSVAIRTQEPEIEVRAYRRRFSTAYKLRILAEADACTEPGAIGALLRRDGLYSSHLSTWRAQRAAGARAAWDSRGGASRDRPWSAKMPGFATSWPARRTTWRKPAR